MNHAVFVKNGSGAGIGSLTPTWAAWVGVGGAISLGEPTVTESSTVTGLYTFAVTATTVPIFGRLDFGLSVTDIAERYREFLFDPSDGVVTPTRAARLDNAGLDSITAQRAANLDQIDSTRMGLIDGLTSGRTGNLDNIGGTRMGNLDGLGSAVGAIGSAVVTIDGVVDGIAADVAGIPAAVAAVPGAVWDLPMPTSPAADSMADWVATSDSRVWAFTLTEGAPGMAVLLAGICDCVWDKLATDAYDPETMGWAMQCLLAMTTKGNVLLQGATYDGDKLTSVSIRLFRTKAELEANLGGHLLETTVSASYTGDNLTGFGGTRPNP